MSTHEWAFLPCYNPIVTLLFTLFLPQNMRYDELISLEREAVFLYSSVNETNAAFLLVFRNEPYLCPKKSILRDFSFHFVKLPDGMLLPRENR